MNGKRKVKEKGERNRKRKEKEKEKGERKRKGKSRQREGEGTHGTLISPRFCFDKSNVYSLEETFLLAFPKSKHHLPLSSTHQAEHQSNLEA